MPQIVPGTTVAATVTGVGEASGRVMMQYGVLALSVEIVKWEGNQATFVVPEVALKESAAVKLLFPRADGELAQAVDCELVAATIQQQP